MQAELENGRRERKANLRKACSELTRLTGGMWAVLNSSRHRQQQMLRALEHLTNQPFQLRSDPMLGKR